jgi:hypothetical protein
MPANNWRVVETPCFPNSWKVVNDHYRLDNAACNYFPTIVEAQAEADKRNDREPVKCQNCGTPTPKGDSFCVGCIMDSLYCDC